MRKIFTLFMFICFAGFNLSAQLADGSIAPDFTATDIEGNTWNLYDVLDSGKSVVLDVSATWCGPCWSYHEGGTLEELYETHGPNGDNTMMVFMIEGDASTNLDCLYNNPGCNSTTLGDWTEGVEYPIIDDSSIADLYQIAYYPTLYHICANRIVTEAGQVGAADFFAAHNSCAVAVGANNAGIVSYDGAQGAFCVQEVFAPTMTFQNLGNDVLTSVMAELYVNGNLAETTEWTGSVNTFGFDQVVFSEMTVTENTEIEIRIISSNNADDEDTSDNSVSAALAYAQQVNENLITLEVRTDEYPAETYWELRDSEGRLFYNGGNALAFGLPATASGTYVNPNTVYKTELVLPGDGCFQFNIFDAYGDGICCTYGDGYYQLSDVNDNIISEGGAFGAAAQLPFEVSEAPSVSNNGAIVSFVDESGYVCGAYEYSPQIGVQNLGADPITSMTVDVSVNGALAYTYAWSGDIATGDTGSVSLDPVTIEEASAVTVSINEINGEVDNYEYQNLIETAFDKLSTTAFVWGLELELDSYAEECYWQVTNEAGDVLASGGNETVGANGAGTGLADATGAGAYGANELVTEVIVLPESDFGCYTFLLIDSYGDGLVDGGGGYVKLTDPDGNAIIDEDLSSVFYGELPYVVNFDAVSSVQELEDISDLTLSPNPTDGYMEIKFDLDQAKDLNLSVYDVLGQHVTTISQQNYAAGLHVIDAQLNELNNGMYSLRLTDGQKMLTRKFTVIK